MGTAKVTLLELFFLRVYRALAELLLFMQAEIQSVHWKLIGRLLLDRKNIYHTGQISILSDVIMREVFSRMSH
jgi:hypothetical protein